MFSDDPHAGKRQDHGSVDAARGPPTLPVFPAAPTPVRARNTAVAAHHHHAARSTEEDDADADKYAKHVPVAATDGATTGVPVIHAAAGVVGGIVGASTASVPVAPGRGRAAGLLGSRRAALARTRCWAVRIVVALVLIWLLLMQLVVWDDNGPLTSPPNLPPYRGGTTTTTMAVPTTTTTTSTFVPVPTRDGTSTHTATITTTTTTITTTTSSTLEPSTVLSPLPPTPIASSSSLAPTSDVPVSSTIAALAEARAPQEQQGSADSDDASSAVEVSVIPKLIADAAHEDEDSSSANSETPPEDKADPTAAAVAALSVSLAGAVSSKVSVTSSSTPTAMPVRPVRGTFTVVTVIDTPEVLVEMRTSGSYVARDVIAARRFQYVARGLARSGLPQHVRFYEWLVFRPAAVSNAVVAQERAAVQQWWRDEQGRTQRDSASAALASDELSAQLSASCRAQLADFALSQSHVYAGDIAGGVVGGVVGSVRVTHSQRTQVVKPAALWLEALTGVQTPFVVVHALEWGVRLPGPTSLVFNASAPADRAGVPRKLAQWYNQSQPRSGSTLRRMSSSTTTTAAVDGMEASDACPSIPLSPLQALRQSFVAHLFDVGARVLATDEKDALSPIEAEAQAPVVPPVIVNVGNFRDATERAVHIYRLQYYASAFDGEPAARELALTRQLQRFLGLIGRGEGNLGHDRLRVNASGTTTTTAEIVDASDEEDSTSSNSTSSRRTPVMTGIVDGLPTAQYGADQLYHCHRAPLYAVQLPVPDYMRGGAAGATQSASDAATISLCDVLINRRHHGYMANYTAEPLPFYKSYCKMWQTLVGPEQTLLAAQPALKTGDKKEDAARKRQLEKVQGRLLKPNQLAEGVCMYEWVRVLKEAQQKTIRRSAPPRPSQLLATPTPASSGARRRQAPLLSVDNSSALSSSSSSSYEDMISDDTRLSADFDTAVHGTPLQRYARMLFSTNQTERLHLAHHFLALAGPNISQTLEQAHSRVSRKLETMAVSYVVADGRRRNKRQQDGDLEVACMPSRTAVFSMAPAMYDKEWLVKTMVFKCRKRLKECVGVPAEDSGRSMQRMQTYLSSSTQWSQGSFQICTVPGVMVEDTTAGILASENALRQQDEA